ncbi:MAG: hypothetical protein ACYS22_17170 [Planctomycetota bacterium]
MDPKESGTERDGTQVLSHDLRLSLRDGYLRRIAIGHGGQTLEVGVHRMRYLAPAPQASEEGAAHLGAGERERVVGLRFRNVVAAASEAFAQEAGDDAAWERAPEDWVMALCVGDGMPPIVRTASLGAASTWKHLRELGDDLLWHAGSPESLEAASSAPWLFEVTAEGLLPSGTFGKLRLFVAAHHLDVRDASGLTSLESIANDGEAFQSAWEAYWERRAQDPSLLDDLRFEWLQPDEDGEEDRERG